MYDRAYEDKTLTFEPSGGLLEAALVMRDRETDSWWAIMQGRSIGGPMEGRALRELSIGEKTTWGDWRRRHPETLVLVVDGRTHDPENRYDAYFTSDRTFRNQKASDDRLPAKEPIYAFRLGDRSFAAAHRTLAGGRLESIRTFGPGDSPEDMEVFLFRESGASVFATTRAWIVPRGLISRRGGRYVIPLPPGEGNGALHLESLDALEALADRPGVRPLVGMDTYWYTWIAVNPGTALIE